MTAATFVTSISAIQISVANSTGGHALKLVGTLKLVITARWKQKEQALSVKIT